MANVDITESEDGVVLTVKVVPGASRTAIAGELDGMVKIKVSAAPEKGKANQCLVEFIAGRLGVKKKSVNIVSGQTSALKRVQISGITAEDVLSELMRPGRRSK
jgi:uncharacterized protein (TIGR00251 family)